MALPSVHRRTTMDDDRLVDVIEAAAPVQTVRGDEDAAYLRAMPGSAGRSGSLTNRKGLRLAVYLWPHSTGTEFRGVVGLLHGHGSHTGFEFLRAPRTPGGYPAYEGSWVEALNARGFSVAGMDFHGMGRSEGVKWYVDRFDDYVDDAEILVRAITRGVRGVPGFPSACRPFLIANSMGGGVCAHILHRAACSLSLSRSRSRSGGDGRGGGEREPPTSSSSDPRALSYLGGVAMLSPMLSLQSVERSQHVILTCLARALDLLWPWAQVVRGGKENSCSEDQQRWERDPYTSGARPTRVRNALEYLRACRRERTMPERVPVLLFHSRNDSWTDFSGTELYYETSRSRDKTLHPLDGNEHLLTQGPRAPTVLTHVLDWITQRADARRALPDSDPDPGQQNRGRDGIHRVS